MVGSNVKKTFFFEKKNQKTFVRLGRGSGLRMGLTGRIAAPNARRGWNRRAP
jgi:hypothetical protein